MFSIIICIFPFFNKCIIYLFPKNYSNRSLLFNYQCKLLYTHYLNSDIDRSLKFVTTLHVWWEETAVSSHQIAEHIDKRYCLFTHIRAIKAYLTIYSTKYRICYSMRFLISRRIIKNHAANLPGMQYIFNNIYYCCYFQKFINIIINKIIKNIIKHWAVRSRLRMKKLFI